MLEPSSGYGFPFGRGLKIEDEKDFLADGPVDCDEPPTCARTSACAAQKQMPNTQTQHER
jgi:hypothetical protein